ncbi:Uncaracterized surface protein containing fasciclin (FAS1) repeats [Catalinimonas alkaloidigena]|uniref:Uncaracterized surface protein containing fasciclin (FAS1) repeats n=1 Tax=Catalinimonas alkaloidigena TaxID=1075417 RepID=A0A1G9N1B7_9BACT|nr:fasciclin domain-containing protein [Catalinimonas alkaloidigena]SDL80310.1 Uncaracterized surface protein containing fasciclin (FAS1) repeats [Catalinimonas alkaloidigena]
MIKKTISALLLTGIVAASTIPARAQVVASSMPYVKENMPIKEMVMEPTKSITVNVVVNEHLNYFREALMITDLGKTLNNQDGPFTVFAPIDEAFDMIPERYLNVMMEDRNEILTDLLRYHIVPGQIDVAQLKDGQHLKTLQGKKLRVSRKGDQVYINGAPILTSNIASRNGVIHTIGNIAMIP